MACRPLTTSKTYPFRVAKKVAGKRGVAGVGQIRTVDKQRLVKRLGTLPTKASQCLLNTLAEVFTERGSEASREKPKPGVNGVRGEK